MICVFFIIATIFYISICKKIVSLRIFNWCYARVTLKGSNFDNPVCNAGGRHKKKPTPTGLNKTCTHLCALGVQPRRGCKPFLYLSPRFTRGYQRSTPIGVLIDTTFKTTPIFYPITFLSTSTLCPPPPRPPLFCGNVFAAAP
jgi:hypothetical protein